MAITSTIFSQNPILASKLIFALGDRITLLSHAAHSIFSGLLHEDGHLHIVRRTRRKKKKRIRSYPAPGFGLFQRGVPTLRRSTGMAFGAAMGRLLAVDVVNHMMRQRYKALVIGSDFHGN